MNCLIRGLLKWRINHLQSEISSRIDIYGHKRYWCRDNIELEQNRKLEKLKKLLTQL